jgi:hypothetical protein
MLLASRQCTFCITILFTSQVFRGEPNLDGWPLPMVGLLACALQGVQLPAAALGESQAPLRT